jgi:hypothetical protein
MSIKSDVPSSSPDSNSEPEKTFKLAFGEGPKGVKLSLRELTFSEFSEFCSTPQQGTKHETWFLRGGDVQHVKSHTTSGGKEYGPGYYRGNKYLKSACFLIIDGDSSLDDEKSAPPPKLVHRALKHFGIKHFLYTTHSHSKTVNKFRVVIPCSMDKSQCLPTSKAIIKQLNDFGIPIKWVREMGVWAQIWYLPTRDDPTDELFEYYEHLEGEDYCAVDGFDEPKQDKPTGSSSNTGSLTFDEHFYEFMETGEGHIHYAPMCQSLANEGKSVEKIIKRMTPLCQRIFAKHDREWNDDRDQNLLEAAETAVVKVEGEKAASNPRIEVYEHVDDKSIASNMKRLPDDILAPDDRFGLVVRIFDNAAWKSNLMTSHIGAMASVAHAMGGRYAGMDLSDRPCDIEIAVGNSGCGKSNSVDMPVVFYGAMFCTSPDLAISKRLGISTSDEISTWQGLEELYVQMLTNNPDVLFRWDEMGDAIEEALQNKKSDGSKFLRRILKAWPTHHLPKSQRVTAGKVNDSQSEIIYAPHLHIAGAATEGSFTDAVDRSFAMKGTSARMLLYPATIYAGKSRSVRCEMTIPGHIKDGFIKMLSPLKGKIHTPVEARVYDPRRVKWGKEVVDFLGHKSDQIEAMPEGLKFEIWNRLIPHVKRKMMKHATMNNVKRPIVTLKMAESNYMIVEHACEYQYRLFRDGIGENKTDLALKKCLECMKKAKGKPVAAKDLHHLYAMKKLSPFERGGVLKDMCDVYGYKKNEAANVRGKATITYTPNIMGEIDENN